jgi:predicted Rossmann fold nucleotide-binding protein DprA/Smf involved in DNA uptake
VRVIIAGSRDFNDYELLKKHCDYLLQNQKEVEIISGGARGADKLGERYASGEGDIYTIAGTDYIMKDVSHWMPLPSEPICT